MSMKHFLIPVIPLHLSSPTLFYGFGVQLLASLAVCTQVTKKLLWF